MIFYDKIQQGCGLFFKGRVQVTPIKTLTDLPNGTFKTIISLLSENAGSKFGTHQYTNIIS